jgi:hypothetical protein
LSLITTLGVVAVGAINGILIAVALALARFVRQAAPPREGLEDAALGIGEVALRLCWSSRSPFLCSLLNLGSYPNSTDLTTRSSTNASPPRSNKIARAATLTPSRFSTRTKLKDRGRGSANIVGASVGRSER